MAKGNHSFTEQDIRKRFGAIVGHTVAEVDTAGVLTASAGFAWASRASRTPSIPSSI